MNLEIAIPSTVTLMHFLLAYFGMLIHIFFKIDEKSKQPNFKLRKFLRANIFSIIATFLSIPVLLIMAADGAIAEILPINNVTAVLAGWQTNSVFRNLMTMFAKRTDPLQQPDV